MCHPTATKFSIVSNTSSTLVANISKPYRVIVEGLKATLSANVVQIVNAYESSGQANEWYLDGFSVDGDVSAVTRLMTFTLAVGGVDPTSIDIVNPRYTIPNTITLVAKSGTTLAGVIATMPEFTANAELTVSIGDKESLTGGSFGFVINDHPIFPSVPQNFITTTGNGVVGATEGYLIAVAPFPGTTGGTRARLATSTYTAATVARTSNVSSTVTMKKFIL